VLWSRRAIEMYAAAVTCSFPKSLVVIHRPIEAN
jgi:hypothetical protein